LLRQNRLRQEGAFVPQAVAEGNGRGSEVIGSNEFTALGRHCGKLADLEALRYVA